MTKFVMYFDRAGFPPKFYEGSLKGCRKYIADIMTKPQIVKGKKVLLSHCAVWKAGKGLIHGDKWYGEFQMASDGKIRVGMWVNPNDKFYVLNRDGSLAESIDGSEYYYYKRKEYRTRASMVKNM